MAPWALWAEIAESWLRLHGAGCLRGHLLGTCVRVVSVSVVLLLDGL